jgi:Fe-S-cluster containining protein
MEHTGDAPEDFVKWVDRDGIEMRDEPEAFVGLRQGKRVMVLRHQRGRCRYLGADDRCTIYASRPLGCRIFPFDPDFNRKGELRRLRLIQVTECPYTLEGKTRVPSLRALNRKYAEAQQSYHAKVAAFNRAQRARRRRGLGAHTAKEFLRFLGLTR